MSRELRLPALLAFTVIGGSALAIGATSCGHGSQPIDAAPSGCELFCISDGTDAGVCNACVDDTGACTLAPPGPCPSGFACTLCAGANGTCPAGCRPVG